MSERAKRRKSEKEKAAEKTSRFFRNINAVGAVALGGAAIIAPPLAVPLSFLAGINALQAGGFEAARRHFRKKRLKKEEKDSK